MIAPIFKELSEEHGSKAQFIKVDVDDNPEAAQKYGVSAMPTFVFIKGGEVVDRLMGANSDRLKEVCVCIICCFFSFILSLILIAYLIASPLPLAYKLIEEWSL